MSEDKKAYEICYLLKDPAAEQEVLDLLKQFDGEIMHRGQLKEIRLAYPIKKQLSAHFGFLNFSCPPENVAKLSDALKLKPMVLRHMIISYVPPAEKKAPEGEAQPKEMAKDFGKPAKEVKPAPASDILSNEALEKKLEEILQ